MLSVTKLARLLTVGGASASLILFGALQAAAVANADSSDIQPNCTAADLAGIASGVSASESAYLFTHPDVNNFFTGLQGKSRDEIRSDLHTYLDANPDVKSDLTGIRQPMHDFKDRCGAPTSGVPSNGVPGA